MTDTKANGKQAFIGVDVGGTHTDVSVVYDGRVERGKALTTYDDFSRGVLEAVEVAAVNYELSMDDLLDRTKLFINGTTVVTNTITQRWCARHERVPRRVPSRRRPAYNRD